MQQQPLFKILPAIVALVAAACSGGASPTPGTALSEPTSPPATLPPSDLASNAPTLPPDPTKTPGCSVISESFAPEPPADSPFPAVTARDWAQGPEEAPITIVEYGDFQ